MEKEEGTLINWNNKKGFGFIRPHNGKEIIFLHARFLPHHQRRPKEGDVLTYEVDVDEKNRYYACSAKIQGLAWSWFTVSWILLLLLFGVYLYFVFQQTLPFHPLAIYAAMSLLTIWAYSRDKQAAQSGERRTRERTLHLLEILGGWPGALLAQRSYRHKIRKWSYQIVFWLIVAGHAFLWYYLLTQQDTYRPYQQTATEYVQSLKGTVLHLFERGSAQQEQTRAITPQARQPEQTGALPSQTSKRSTVKPPFQARVIEGTVTEIRPDEGIIVALQSEVGTEGILDKSTLVDNFSTQFTQGEHIQVTVHAITIEGKHKRIELILVEK